MRTILKKIWLVALLFLFGKVADAQCDYRLVEQAAEQAGSNTVFLRDFRFRLSEATMDDPVPTGSFPVYLNRDVRYRFTVANNRNEDGQAIVDLVRRGQVYGSNVTRDMYSNSFDFECQRSATYQLQVNFGQGNKGCAAVVMSLIMEDSLTYIRPGEPMKSDSLETLYLWTKNEIQIATSLGKDYKIEAKVSQGNIWKEGKFYTVLPEKEGELFLYAIVRDTEGNFVESDTIRYFVDKPSLPKIILPDERDGVISISSFNGLKEITIEDKQFINGQSFKLQQFSLSATASGLSSYTSYSKYLSVEQIKFIRSIKPGGSFYITTIRFLDASDKVVEGESRLIYVFE